jgi:hypothetical protein
MLTRMQGGLAAAVVIPVTVGLVVLDLTDVGFREWWAARPLTTDTVAGVLVLLVTVLVVDQVVRSRQVNDRSRAVAAQAAILMGQAARSSKAVSSALDGSGDSAAASDAFRTYMLMLLVGAPVLIDATVSRKFLEEAQLLGAELARALASMTGTPDATTTASARLAEALDRLRKAAAPLLRPLNLEELLAAAGDGPAVGAAGGNS